MTKRVKIPDQQRAKDVLGGGKVRALNARHRRRVGAIKLFGAIKFEPDFNYKAERARQ